MTFKTWMKQKYMDGPGRMGKLAYDIWTDDKFPMNGNGKFDGWHRVIEQHLQRCGANPVYVETFEQCWEEYVKCEKERLNRSSRRR